jgi:hypothetical protein
MRFTSLVILMLAGTLAFAAPAVKDKRSTETIATETDREFAIPVPQSEIKMEEMRFKPSPPVDLAVSASSWVPSNFTRGGYAGAVSKFGNSGAPPLSVNRIGQFMSLDNGAVNLSSKIGFTYFTMDRTTARDDGSVVAGTSTESLSFFMGRVGIESDWTKILPWHLEPNMSFSLLPTWVSASKSQYEGKVSAFGLPYEATAGLLWRINPSERPDFGDISVGVSAQTVSGTIAGSSLKGLGILGELRVSL